MQNNLRALLAWIFPLYYYIHLFMESTIYHAYLCWIIYSTVCLSSYCLHIISYYRLRMNWNLGTLANSLAGRANQWAYKPTMWDIKLGTIAFYVLMTRRYIKLILQEEYTVNLVIYRRSDIAPHAWRTYTESIPVLTVPVYLDMPRPKLKLRKIDANISSEYGMSATPKLTHPQVTYQQLRRTVKVPARNHRFLRSWSTGRPSSPTRKLVAIGELHTSLKQKGAEPNPHVTPKIPSNIFRIRIDSLDGETDTPSNPPTEEEYRPSDETQGLLLK